MRGTDEYMFLVEHTRLTKREIQRRERIAKKHDCDFVYLEDRPGFPGVRSWFAGRNFGEPFDSQLRAAVQHDIENPPTRQKRSV